MLFSPVRLHSVFKALQIGWLLLPALLAPAHAGDGAPIQSPPAWLQGWSIVKLRIPKNGDIQEAYAELKTPAGRTVTLTAGEPSIEGVSLDKLRWSGSPVRAKVTLRNGTETTELFVETSRIAKEQALQKKEPNVAVDVQLIAMPEAVAKALSIEGRKLLHPMDSGPKNTLGVVPITFCVNLAAVLNQEQREKFLLGLAPQKEVHIFKAARGVAKPRIREVIQVLRDAAVSLPAPAAGDGPNHQSGVVLEVEATATEGGTIDLILAPQIAEFEPPSKQIFSTRSIASIFSIFSGQTVILSGFQGPEITDASAAPRKTLLLLVTARNLALEEPSQ